MGLAVMARTMKSIHFSLLMFWFSAIGMVILTTFFVLYACITQSMPRIFTYDYDQMYNLVLLELTGAALITSFNLFTIVYKMFYSNDSDEEDEEKESSKQKYGMLDCDDEELVALNEDSYLNESYNEFGF